MKDPYARHPLVSVLAARAAPFKMGDFDFVRPKLTPTFSFWYGHTVDPIGAGVFRGFFR